jgi:hypothetical protein
LDLRVLLINDYGIPVGGAERLLAGLAKGLQRKGHQIRLIAGCAADPEGKNMAELC